MCNCINVQLYDHCGIERLQWVIHCCVIVYTFTWIVSNEWNYVPVPMRCPWPDLIWNRKNHPLYTNYRITAIGTCFIFNLCAAAVVVVVVSCQHIIQLKWYIFIHDGKLLLFITIWFSSILNAKHVSVCVAVAHSFVFVKFAINSSCHFAKCIVSRSRCTRMWVR